ncbi:chondroitinase-B domain-containing protein [Formosa sp. 3Alg 14/1]|uniref:chondroitinase-B domain-containing protein n=1 Tax=Formosa sp. 3Alg 14/1 TaxID=3382190 RepID=UPI0039BE3B9F
MRQQLFSRMCQTTLCVVVFLCAFQSYGADYTVNSASEFNNLSLSPGDVVTWANGTYSSDQRISFTANGSASNPIILRAETPGGVIFTGQTNMDISGDYVIIDGFYWNGGAGSNNHIQFRKSSAYANHSTIRNCAFNNLTPSGTDKHRWIVLYGTNNTVENCSFLNKNSPGALILVELEYNDFNPVGHVIKDNYFFNFIKRDPSTTHSGDSETIRVGTSEFQDKSASVTVEGNYFYKADGENEIITNKSADNTYRNNTFRRCRGSLVMRHGARATVDGNYFLGENVEGTGGIRITDSYHVITNNYIQDVVSSGDKWNNGITLVGGSDTSGGITNGYQKVDDIVVENNTLYNVDSPIFFNDRSSYDPSGVLNNNVIYTTLTNIVSGDISGTGQSMTYNGNVYYGASLGISDSGFTEANPQFSENGEIYSASSSAVSGKGSSISNPHTNSMVGVSVGASFIDASGNSASGDYLTVSTVSEFTAEETTKTVSVSSSVDWSVANNKSWISITPTSGSGNGSISVTVSANVSETSRTGTIIVSGSGVSNQTISITQAGTTDSGGNAGMPSDLMANCNQWKITYPTGEEDKTLCDEEGNEFFYVNDEGNAIVFRAPVRSDNGTTPNSDNIRSELREREADGSKDIYWTTEGTHELYVKQAITHLPINKSQLVATQIHGNKADGIDDSMVMRLEDNHLFLSFNGGKLRSNVTITENYTLGDIHEVIFKVIDGKHYCYYAEDGNLKNAYTSGNASQYLVRADGNDYVMDKNYDQSYFKVGNYTQSNPVEEGDDTDDPDNYGEVLVYDFSVSHGEGGEPVDPIGVTGVSFSSSTIDLALGSEQQLTATVSPSDATNKNVSYSSSSSSIVSVSSSGELTAVSEGNATITVTTADGDFTDTIAVQVVAPSSGDNLALNKSISGTGTPDGDNTVANLVDGNTETRWSVSGMPQTATIDLGGIFTLGSTALVCYSDRAYQYTISVSSSENGSYTEVVNRSSNATPGLVSSPISDTFNNIEARFVKITVTGASSYEGNWVSLLELSVFAGEGEPATVDVTSVTLNASSINLEAGETQQLAATVSPSDATNQDVSYTSSNTSVATVNSNGLVEAISEGSATITVTTDDGSFTDSLEITVNGSQNGTAPYSISKFQDYLAQCKLQSPLSGTEATDAEIISGYSSNTFYVADGNKLAFYQSRDNAGTRQRSELRFLENWNVNDDQIFHANVNIVNQTCEQLTFMQIHDDANVGNGPNKPLLRIYQSGGHIWAAVKTDDGGANTSHVDLGETPNGYFDCDIILESGVMIVEVNGAEKLNTDVSYWTYPSYWKNGVYLQDSGEATVHFNELTLTGDSNTTPPTAESTNVALEKSVAFSTEQSSNPASNLVDGDEDSRWSAQSYPVWATVDLGSLHTINSTEVICYNDRAYKYIIEVSTDGSNFSQIVNRSNNTTSGSNSNPIADSFSEVDARYVRITVTGAHSYDGDWASIDELRVFGYSKSVSARGISPETQIASFSEPELALYPNPTTNTVNIRGAKAYHTLTVYDQVGKVIFNRPLDGETVDISNLKSGMYIFRLSGNDTAINKRIIKK